MRLILILSIFLFGGCSEQCVYPKLHTIPIIKKHRRKDAVILVNKLRISERYYYNEISRYNRETK